MIESQCKRVVDVERAAEAYAAVQRKAVAPLQQQSDHLQEIFVPAHRDAVFGNAAEAGHRPSVQRFDERREIAHRLERDARAIVADTRPSRFKRLDFQAVDANDRVAVVHQMVGEREAGRSHADDERAFVRRRCG